MPIDQKPTLSIVVALVVIAESKLKCLHPIVEQHLLVEIY
jgi:hypothetical protein